MNAEKKFHQNVISILSDGFSEAVAKGIEEGKPEHIAESAAMVSRILGNLAWSNEEDIRNAAELAANISDEVEANGYNAWVWMDVRNLKKDLNQIVESFSV